MVGSFWDSLLKLLIIKLLVDAFLWYLFRLYVFRQLYVVPELLLV